MLLLEHQENQRLLAEELSQRNEVVTATSDDVLNEDFDLCVLDGPALDRLWERVQELKQREQPILLPVLLITSRPDAKMITRHVWRSVDELIITPIEKLELRARVEILLRARALSVQLRRRVEEAEDAARARDEVIAVVSHDLRNPLNLVMTNATLLQDMLGELEPGQRRLLDMVERAAQQMHRLIRDLLEVAAMEAGNVTVELRPELPSVLVEESCSTLAHAAATSSIALACTRADDLPPVLADRDRILQVLGNLIGNALKFTGEGGSISVGATRQEDNVLFFVEDSGTGIDPEDLPHIFDRFWQAKQARKAGAGLGLAIARRIVKAHGGDLWATSERGRGSTFFFTLPVSPEAPDAARNPPAH